MDENKSNVYEEELKPCPFCGGEAKIVSRSTEVKKVNFGTAEVFSTDILEWCKIKCSDCGCSTDRYANVGGAIKWWNKRAADKSGSEEELRNLKEYLCKREDKVKKQEHCMAELRLDMKSIGKSFDEFVLPKIDAFKEKLDNFPY
jgi:hypothetical protein